MYFYRWFLEKAAAAAVENNESTFIQGSESDVGGTPKSSISEEGHSFEPGHEATVKAQVGEIKPLFRKADKAELGPSIRGDKTPAQMKKTASFSSVGRIVW